MRAIVLLLAALILPITAYADNVNFSQGSGKTAATDTIGGIEYPRTKISLGADGAFDGDVSYDTNRMPIETANKDGFFGTNTTDITNTTSTEIVAAGSGGIRHYVETFIVSNSHPTQGTVVQLLDGTTVKAQCPAAPNYGGCTVTFPTPLRGSVNTAWNCKAVTSGAAVRCTVVGHDLAK